MDKMLDLPINFKSMFRKNEWTVFVQIPDEAVGDFCLGIWALREKMVKTLVVKNKNGNFKLVLEMNESFPPQKCAVTKRIDHENLNIVLSFTELDYWAGFFLEYFVNGFGDADHIDLAVEKSNQFMSGYLVLEFEKSKPPVSIEEAHKLLEDLK